MKRWKLILLALDLGLGLHLGCQATAPRPAPREGVAALDAPAANAAFALLCQGEIDVADLPRPPTAAEAAWCRIQGASYVETPAAAGGVSLRVPRRDPPREGTCPDEVHRLASLTTSP